MIQRAHSASNSSAGSVITILHVLFPPRTAFVFCLFTFLSDVVQFEMAGFVWLSSPHPNRVLVLLRHVQGVRGPAGLAAPMPVDMQPHQGLYHYETSPSQPPRG